MVLNSYPHLAPRLKQQPSITSAPPMGLHGLLQDELYLYLLTSPCLDLTSSPSILQSKEYQWAFSPGKVTQEYMLINQLSSL
jgi:hypothetical protein